VSGQRIALIVATDEYDHSDLPNLLAPVADAQSLGRVLSDPQIGNFNVQATRNQPAHVIQAQIEELFADRRPDDMLLLHISCHGLKSESGELFFGALNTRPNRLASTAIPADFVQRCMRESRSRSIVVLLDCCYGGAFTQGVTVRSARNINVLDNFRQDRSGGRGRAVITASSAMEYAFEGNEVTLHGSPRPSVFTAALVEGLATGDADHDEDGWISLNELYDYVFDKVRDRNPHQTPGRQVELEGELYLARSRKLRIQGTPIPTDLRVALTDSNMYARRGAIIELRSRLLGENLPAAFAAFEALSEVARSDIQFVADAARAALHQAVVAVDQPELDFGQVRQGSKRPHRTVQVLGPPLARSCVPRTSHDWIHIVETASGLDISVDTDRTGTLHGSIALKGSTGETVITVVVNLVPSSFRPAEPRRTSTAAYQRNPSSTAHTGRVQAPPVFNSGAASTASPGFRNRPQHQTGERLTGRNTNYLDGRVKPTTVTDSAPIKYPPITKQFSLLLIYLLPVTVIGFLIWLILIPFFTPNRILRINIIQSFMIFLIFVASITFSINAGSAGKSSAGPLWLFASVGYISTACLLLVCIVCVIKGRQPDFPGLTSGLWRITSGKPGARPPVAG
jgi:Caspase domain